MINRPQYEARRGFVAVKCDKTRPLCLPSADIFYAGWYKNETIQAKRYKSSLYHSKVYRNLYFEFKAKYEYIGA